MVVGVPKEVKSDEYRVALTLSGVMELKRRGHTVLVQSAAGEGTHITDAEYADAGAEVVNVDDVWTRADMIVKVKEPQESEFTRIKPNQLVFTYFHFAAEPHLMQAMLKTDAYCIAYETVQLPNGSLPLLTPMSEVAGRLSIQQGAKYLERPMGGRGVLLSGVPGTHPAVVAVIGAGTVGINAIKVAAGFGALVYVLDVNLDRLRYLDEIFPDNVITLHSNPGTIKKILPEVDLLIGAVYIPGSRAPVLVSREDLKLMKSGSVIVDVCVDQGGCFESTRPTTHKDPVYVEEGVLHYGVTNMPGAVANTSTFALTNATLPFVTKLANDGLAALKADASLLKGLNVAKGHVTYKAVADHYNLPFTDPMEILN